MQLGVFAKTFPGSDPDTVLKSAAEAGFATVHYNMVCSGLPSMPDVISPDVAAAISRAARKREVAICGVSGTFNMIHPDPDVRRRGLERLDVIARSADAMGTDLVTLCTGTRDAEDRWRGHPDNATPEAWQDLRVVMAEAVAIAEKHDVRLGIEPELANVVSSAALARRLIDELQSDRIRVVLDPANLFDVQMPDARRRLVSEAIDQLADLIVVAHAKDRAPDGAATAPGTGVVDFDHYLRELEAIGFRGPIVAHGFAADDATNVARFLRRRLASHPERD
jgi:sugar phosphate isomerase/epimerase